MLLYSCSPPEYPITTRYKEKNIKTHYVKLPNEKKSHRLKNNFNRDIIIFSIGTIIMMDYINRAK